MSRIDQHIARAQQKLAFGQFVGALALAAQAVAVVAIVAIVVLRVLGRSAPGPGYLLLAVIAIVLAGCGIIAYRRRPSRMDAAVAIDRTLQLKESFSTALYARGNSDAVAVRVVADAERAADNVTLHNQFQLQWPRRANAAIALIIVALLAAWLMPSVNLWPAANHGEADAIKKQKNQQTQQFIRNALARVDQAPPTVANDPAVQAARAQLADLLKHPVDDPNQAHDAALAALQNVKAALDQEIAKNQKYAEARDQAQMLSTLDHGADPNNPVNQASRDMANGDYKKAADALHQAVSNFDHMSDAQQQQTIDAMKKLASQMSNLANDPAVAQQLAQKFQQMGADPAAAQQMAKLMQKAAQGDADAQQQLQDMVQKIQSQANNGQGLTQKQQDQVNKMMAQMQAQAAAQANAKQMAQAAKKIASAMQKQHGIPAPMALRKGGQGDKPGNKPGDQSGQPDSSQANSQGQNGQPSDQDDPNGQPQPGSSGAEQSSSDAMSQGDSQMSDALTQMDAVAADAQQAAAAAQAAQNDANAAAGSMSGNGGNGQWSAGDPQGNGQGQGGAGHGAGGKMDIAKAPFKMAPRIDPSQNTPGGRILAATMVQGDQLKGEAKAQMQTAAESAEQQAADDVDEDSVTGPQQKVIQQYFDAIGHDKNPN